MGTSQENRSGDPATQYSEKIFSDNLETQAGRYLWDNMVAAGICGVFRFLSFSLLYMPSLHCTKRAAESRGAILLHRNQKEKTPGAKMGIMEMRNICIISLAEMALH